MAVSIKHTSDVTAVVTIEVKKADYQPEVDKALKTYRQRAEIPGFRKGHAPMGMIQKKFGLGAKIEEINRFVGQQLYTYINDNKLRVLGEPMPAEGAPEQDLEKGDDFEFVFDLALTPKIEVKLTKEDKLPYYHIDATDEMVSSHIEHLLNMQGRQQEVESVEARDIVHGRLVELEQGEVKDGGLVVEGALIMPEYIKDEAGKAAFIGQSNHSVVIFEPYAAYEGNKYELASLLKIDKDQVEAYQGVQFSFEISSIKRHIPAELNEEFYIKAFGEEGDVRDEEALKAKIRESFREQFDPESDYKLLQDSRELILKKAGQIEYPEALLKRWLKMSNDKLTQEEIDRDFAHQLELLTFQIVKDALLAEHQVEVTQEEVLAFAVVVAKSQFAQYGMSSVPDEVLHSYAKSMLEKEDTARSLSSRVLDNKFAAIVKELVSLEERHVSPEEFGKLVNPEA